MHFAWSWMNMHCADLHSGMLICGFCLRNVPGIKVAANIDPNWSSTLRSMALSVILIKAGLELDAKVLSANFAGEWILITIHRIGAVMVSFESRPWHTRDF